MSDFTWGEKVLYRGILAGVFLGRENNGNIRFLPKEHSEILTFKNSSNFTRAEPKKSLMPFDVHFSIHGNNYNVVVIAENKIEAKKQIFVRYFDIDKDSVKVNEITETMLIETNFY